MSNVRKNFIYNILFQIISVVIPIILAPFLSRTLGPDGMGTYSFTYSIAYYFMLFTMLGVNNYGSRTIAKVKKNEDKLSKTFFEIHSIQIFLGSVMFLLFLGLLMFCDQQYRNILAVQSIFIISAAFDINWFFYGMEDFKTITIRSLVLKIISCVSIFLLVRNANDIWIYTFIMAITALASQVVLWPFLAKYVKRTRICFSDISKHIKPLVILFVPVVAISLYKIMDKVMIGFMSDINEVGLYEYAEKINSIPLTIITALGTVMLPRVTSVSEDTKKVKNYINESIKFVLFITIPIIFFFNISMSTIIPIYLGPGYDKTIVISILLSITLPIISFANVIRMQYLIPMGKDKIYVWSVVLGALLNLIVNLMLIPVVGSYGACIGTIVAEIAVMLFQTICVWKEISLKDSLHVWLETLAKSFIAYVVAMLVSIFVNTSDLGWCSMQIILYWVIYGLLNIKYINCRLYIPLKNIFFQNALLTKTKK